MSPWIPTTHQLPPLGAYVLARHNRGTWRDSTDQANVNCVVVKRVPSKVEGNNLRPYEWNTFGPTKFFGQDIFLWMPIP